MFGLRKSLRVFTIMKFSKRWLWKSASLTEFDAKYILDAQSAPKRLTIENLIYLCACTENCLVQRAKNKPRPTKKYIIYYLWHYFCLSQCVSITWRLAPFSICYQHYSISSIYFRSHFIVNFFFFITDAKLDCFFFSLDYFRLFRNSIFAHCIIRKKNENF